MCTIVYWSSNDLAKLAGRNMDWRDEMPVNLSIQPRQIRREGMVQQNPLTWTSKYGSIGARLGDKFATDGMNEQGLAGHMLWLYSTDYGARDPQIPGVLAGLWLQWFLDSFATVKEALTEFKAHPFQVVPTVIPTTAGEERTTLHLMIEDLTGDVAIFEYLNGELMIHHGPQYMVMTNDPPLNQQLEQLKGYQSFGGNTPIPGDTLPEHRFVRAAYYLKNLPAPANQRHAVAELMSVIRSAAQPFGQIDPYRPNNSATRWSTVCDLTNKVYYFQSTTSPSLIWVDLKQFDMSPGSSAKKLDLTQHPDLVGDVSQAFEVVRSGAAVASKKQ